MNKIFLITLALILVAKHSNAQDEVYAEFRVTIEPHKESEQQNLTPKSISKKICSNISDFQFENCKQLKSEVLQKNLAHEKVTLYASSDYSQADDFKKSMRAIEFKTAFIEPYYNSKRVSFSDVMSGKYKSSFHKGDVITFKVQIDLKKEMEIKALDKHQLKDGLCETLQELYLEGGLKKYDANLNCAALVYQIKSDRGLGTYSFTNNNIDYQKAERIKNDLIESGYSTTNVIALKNGEIVPLSEVIDQ